MSPKPTAGSIRLKYVASIEMGQSPPSTEYSVVKDSGLPFLQGTADFGLEHPLPQVYCTMPTKVAMQGDILFSVRAPVGELNLADCDYGIGRGLCAIRAHTRLDRGFAWWVLHHARTDLAYEATGSTYEAVAAENVANLFIPLPPLPRQRAIANFLDRETAKIDELISEKERLLELLAEKRRAVVTRAVTRGLDPDVPMRDSGVEWLGEIPEHWYTARLKTVCESLQTGPFGAQLHAEDYVEGGIPVVNPAHLANGKIIPDKRISVDQETAERLVIHELEDGDVVFARRGEIGRCGLVTQREAGWLCGTGSLRARPDKSMLFSKYLLLIMTNTFAGAWLSLMSVGTTMDNLNTEIVGALKVPLPSFEEQIAIVVFIESETAQIDTLYTAAERTIKLLQERRTALISAAVVGQIRVKAEP